MCQLYWLSPYCEFCTIPTIQKRTHKSFARKHQNKPTDEILDLLFKEVTDFGKTKRLEDDATVLVIKRQLDEAKKVG